MLMGMKKSLIACFFLLCSFLLTPPSVSAAGQACCATPHFGCFLTVNPDSSCSYSGICIGVGGGGCLAGETCSPAVNQCFAAGTQIPGPTGSGGTSAPSGPVTKGFFPLVHCPSGDEIKTTVKVGPINTGIEIPDVPADAGIQTAIGCIPTGQMTSFVGFLLKWALGVSGGIMVLMVIVSGYSLVTSSGDPQKVQAVKENLTSIFAGLILIGFSLVLLEVIGADLLQLPRF